MTGFSLYFFSVSALAGELGSGQVARLDDVAGLVGLAVAHVEQQRAGVGEAHGVGRSDGAAAAGAVTELDHDRQNGENRRSCDQERMMDDVFEESIHCTLYATCRRPAPTPRRPVEKGREV